MPDVLSQHGLPIAPQEPVAHRWWMDFGTSIEVDFRQDCRFILVVWAKIPPKNEPIAA